MRGSIHGRPGHRVGASLRAMRPSIFARHVLPLALAGSLGALSVGTTASVGLAGCNGRAASASERLRDAVVGYNDELRFGRNDLAVQRVSGGYRTAFILSLIHISEPTRPY